MGYNRRIFSNNSLEDVIVQSHFLWAQYYQISQIERDDFKESHNRSGLLSGPYSERQSNEAQSVVHRDPMTDCSPDMFFRSGYITWVPDAPFAYTFG